MTLLNGTMTPIQTITVGSGGIATVEFTNIPQTYTDLVVLISGRNEANEGASWIRFNNNTSSVYSYRILSSFGNTTTSGNASSQNLSFSGRINLSGYTANIFSNTSIYITNYASTVINKSFSIDSVTENNATEAQMSLASGLWASTSAITSIQLFAENGDYAQHSTVTLYGVTSAGVGAKATGGIISSDTNYWYHTFTTSGTFAPNQNLTNVDYLVVAGGGSGGTDQAGGGGGGGVRCTVGSTGGGGSLESKLSLTSSTNYTITIGAGGAGGTNAGNSGSSSSISGSGISTITSTGGGRGGGRAGNFEGISGGSGGGGCGGNGSSGSSGGAGTANQGYAGGAGTEYRGGGGGGAGATGSNASGGGLSSTARAGNGGNGISTTISGLSAFYGGGGGGAVYTHAGAAIAAATGGSGGGGNGQIFGEGGVWNSSWNISPTAGYINTGGGGGGGQGFGSAGGSGIVIIRYAK